MRECYPYIARLHSRLSELFELCGVKKKNPELPQKLHPLAWLDGRTREQWFCYLRDINTTADEALRGMKDRILDDWNNQENERRLEELEEQLSRQEELCSGRERECLQLRQEQDRLRGMTEQTIQEEINLIRGIIALRDGLFMKQSWLQSCPEETETAAKVLEGQVRDTAKLLTEIGVEILDECGTFDSSYQTVVETRTAQEPEQIDRVAETFRPGYRFRNEILRQQEVILYAVPQEGESCR